MIDLFVDTSAWYPLAVTSHPDHAVLARELRERIGRGARIVTTNLVVSETHALLLRRVGIGAALEFVQRVRQAPTLVVESTADREARAVGDWLVRFDDQPFSLVDAVSFAVMTERGVRDALTLDRHFAIAGFTVVPGGARRSGG